ncbi:MAG: RNA polymerase sigma factor [Bacteroidales bacterium]
MSLEGNLHTAEDLRWFKNIFDTYYESIRSFAWYKTGNTELADDIVQEVFLRLWQMRHKIDHETIKSLLYTIANNLIKSHYRHLSVVYRFEKNKKEGTGEVGQISADENVRTEEFQAELEHVLAQMPEGAREALLMNRLENLTYEEIASRLGISVKAVEKRMSIALKFLREKINYRI